MLFAHLANLWNRDGLDVRLIGIQTGVVLMVVLCRIELAQRFERRDDRPRRKRAFSFSARIFASAARFCSSLAKKMAERYCVPMSLPWRLSCVGSWASKKTSSSVS